MAVPVEVLTEIFAEIAAGIPTYKAIANAGISCRQFYAAIDADEAQAERYARAGSAGQDALADDLERTAADMSIPPEHKRIMVDVRKWLLSKRAQKKYGDRMLVGSDPDNPIPPLVVIGHGDTSHSTD